MFVYYLLALSPSSYSRFAIDKAWNSPNELQVTNDMVIVYGLFTCFLPSLLRKLTGFLCCFVKVLQSSVSSSTVSRTQPTILSMEVLGLSWGKSRCVQQLLDLWTYICRARNNGRSTDNVRTDLGVDRSTFRLAGHVDRSHLIVLKMK